MSELTIDLFTCIYHFLSPFCLLNFKSVPSLLYQSSKLFWINTKFPTHLLYFFFQKPLLKIGSFPNYKLLEMDNLGRSNIMKKLIKTSTLETANQI